MKPSERIRRTGCVTETVAEILDEFYEKLSANEVPEEPTDTDEGDVANTKDPADLLRDIQIFGPVDQTVIDHIADALALLRDERAQSQTEVDRGLARIEELEKERDEVRGELDRLRGHLAMHSDPSDPPLSAKNVRSLLDGPAPEGGLVWKVANGQAAEPGWYWTKYRCEEVPHFEKWSGGVWLGRVMRFAGPVDIPEPREPTGGRE